jgi:replicative superfamily II helicase
MHTTVTVTHCRSAVEAAFREGTVCILVATSTLGAGVNLPATRVIFRSMKMGGAYIDTGKYRYIRVQLIEH